jgi:hypothetical protein
MSAFVPFLPLIGGAAGKALVGLIAPKPKASAQLRTPTRNAAADAIAGSDRLNKRRGAAANAINGARGMESSLGGKSQLGA